MRLKIFQVDAFSNKLFAGNPAAVVLLETDIDEKIMQDIASENNLSETAFVNISKNPIHIRWFTPLAEVRLCGHATLATAKILFDNYPSLVSGEILFQSKGGVLKAFQKGEIIYLDFPVDDMLESAENDPTFEKALGEKPIHLLRGRDDFLAVFDRQSQIEKMYPDFVTLAAVDSRGVVVTAPGEQEDFVSRCFFPSMGVDEDPVTGSAHTMLIPYWASVMQGKEFMARQLSRRGGELYCALRGDRVLIGGHSTIFLEGMISVK